MFIGRENEIATLHGLMSSDESQFVAVYGRRRVGKTFLIREAYKSHFVFQHTGTYGATRRQQQELEQCGFIRKFTAIGKKTKDATFQLIDNYTLFYFDFISENILFIQKESGSQIARQYSTD